MNAIEREAELYKLARILNIERHEVDFLADEDAACLRVIREGLGEALFAKFRPAFAAFAQMAGILPLRLSAEIAKRVLGPTLSGRIAGEMPVNEAIGMAARLPDAFLADVCLQLEPARARAILADFPLARSVAVTDLLRARGELLTMGQFVDVLPAATLIAATDRIEDPAELLRIGFFVENGDQLDRVITHLSPAMRTAMVDAAARHDLWPQAMHILRRLSAQTRSELIANVLEHDDAVLDSLIRGAAAHDLWPGLLEVGQDLDSETRDRAGARPAFADTGVLVSAIDSVGGNDLWSVFDTRMTARDTARTARVLAVAVDERPDFIVALARRDLSITAESNLAGAAAVLDADTRERVVAACGDTRLASLLADGR